jgi:hypothetical protein
MPYSTTTTTTVVTKTEPIKEAPKEDYSLFFIIICIVLFIYFVGYYQPNKDSKNVLDNTIIESQNQEINIDNKNLLSQ